MSATSFLCLLGLIIALAPVCIMGAALIDRWSLERTEELIDDAVFEYGFDSSAFTMEWPFHFVSVDFEGGGFVPQHKLILTTNIRKELLL